MKIELIQKIIELAEKFDLTELEIEEKNQKLRLHRQAKREDLPNMPMGGQGMSPAAESVDAAMVQPKASQEESATYIKSPMVGTFYRSPSPEHDPFVSTGSDVEPSTVVCIIEAMKVMNEIQAETRGKIIEILVENGDTVDFGRPLFRIEPA